MKITDIRTFIVGNPWKNWLFVKVYTDVGIEGLGEATSGLSTKPVEAALHEMKHLAIGEDPRDIPRLMDKLYRALFLAEDSINQHAFSGLNIACWDILGKSAGLPLYRLLGGKVRDALRAYANGWYQGPSDPVFFAKRAKEVAQIGYTALKFDPFGNSYQNLSGPEIGRAIENVAAVREAVGPNVDILIEAHDRFSYTTAVEVGHRLEPYRPMWYETPCMSNDIDMTCEVARQVPVPVAAGERYTTLRQQRALLAGGVGIIQPETLSMGGISGTLDTAALARAYGAWVAPHCAQSPLTTAINVHIGLSTPNVLIQECFDEFHIDWAKQVLAGCPIVKNGYLYLENENPGHGVTLDENACQAHPYSPHNFLRLFDEGWEKRRISE